MNTTDDLLTVGEVAEMARVSVQTVGRWAKDGTLPAVRPSPRVVRFRRADVARLLTPGADNVRYAAAPKAAS